MDQPSYARRYYLENRDKILERMKHRYRTDPVFAESRNAQRKARIENWDTNPLPMLRTLVHSARHRAKIKNLPFCLSESHLLALLLESDYRCAATGIRLTSPATNTSTAASLDRIDSAGGYVPENVRLVTKLYNLAKLTWSDDEVLRMAVALVNCRGNFISRDIS